MILELKSLPIARIQACYHTQQSGFHEQPTDELDHYETGL